MAKQNKGFQLTWMQFEIDARLHQNLTLLIHRNYDGKSFDLKGRQGKR